VHDLAVVIEEQPLVARDVSDGLATAEVARCSGVNATWLIVPSLFLLRMV
jgi:hypothetical protein